MRTKIEREYIKRVKRLTKSRLNGPNLVNTANTLAFSLLGYSVAFLDWTKTDLARQKNSEGIQYKWEDCTQDYTYLEGKDDED